jgi:hypothetical protein
MSDQIQLTSHQLWIDGRLINITVTKLTPTSIRLTWNIPSPSLVYDGAVVLLSEQKFTPEEFPVDGTRYHASTDWAAPADKIGNAHVVAAFYGFFGDNVNQTSVDVFNIDPNKLYYASIHAASNALQYYTIGKQSYPVETSLFDKGFQTYAGAIPRSNIAPENPYNGQVYYEPSSNNVFVWNASLQAWVVATDKTIPVGIRPPIGINYLFFNETDQNLKFFDGHTWVVCNSSNTRVKLGASWVPYAGATVSGDYPTTPTIGEFIHLTLKPTVGGPSTVLLQVYTLGGWFSPTPDLMQVSSDGGLTWYPISIGDPAYGTVDPNIPQVGDFFYDSSKRDLLVWDGTSWTKADTDSEGSPTSDRLGVGTDGSPSERLRLINVLKHQLGYPQVCVELSEEHFQIAIDNALDTFRQRSDNAYAHCHILITLKQGQTTYYLNDPRNKTDRIVNVIKVHRVNMLGLNSFSSDTGLYAQAFFNQLFQGEMIDLTSIHLFQQLSEQFDRIFAGDLVFTWDEVSRQLTILRRLVNQEERVVLEVVVERTEQELLVDRWAKQWLQGWAESELIETLGMIRSKYGTLPGPNGGITLNGAELLSIASEKQTELLRQILDYEVGNGGVNFGNTAFMIG